MPFSNSAKGLFNYYKALLIWIIPIELYFSFFSNLTPNLYSRQVKGLNFVYD